MTASRCCGKVVVIQLSQTTNVSNKNTLMENSKICSVVGYNSSTRVAYRANNYYRTPNVLKLLSLSRSASRTLFLRCIHPHSIPHYIVQLGFSRFSFSYLECCSSHYYNTDYRTRYQFPNTRTIAHNELSNVRKKSHLKETTDANFA